jgi:hypothetical protein
MMFSCKKLHFLIGFWSSKLDFSNLLFAITNYLPQANGNNPHHQFESSQRKPNKKIIAMFVQMCQPCYNVHWCLKFCFNTLVVETNQHALAFDVVFTSFHELFTSSSISPCDLWFLPFLPSKKYYFIFRGTYFQFSSIKIALSDKPMNVGNVSNKI